MRTDYAKCPTCKDYDFLQGHRCKPAWECRFAKGGPIYVDDDQEWEIVHARDSETAAEKFCEHYDCEGGEYAVLGLGERNPPTVEVRAAGTEGIAKFEVVGEAEPVYHGQLIEPPA